MAHKDALTGLTNRALFFDLAEQSINRATRCNTGLGIMFIDLDVFKAINDTYGHNVGDEVLIQVARRIKLPATTLNSQEDITCSVPVESPSSEEGTTLKYLIKAVWSSEL